MSGMSRLNLLPHWNLLHEAVSKVVFGVCTYEITVFERGHQLFAFLLWNAVHEAAFGICSGFVHMKKQHFDGVATNSFLPTRVKCELSASILN